MKKNPKIFHFTEILLVQNSWGWSGYRAYPEFKRSTSKFIKFLTLMTSQLMTSYRDHKNKLEFHSTH